MSTYCTYCTRLESEVQRYQTCKLNTWPVCVHHWAIKRLQYTFHLSSAKWTFGKTLVNTNSYRFTQET
jgi:hypothetical protein